MPFSHPTLTALRDRAIEDVTTSGVPGLDGLLRNSVLRQLAWVEAGLTYSLYGYLDWIAHECVPWSATDEYLEAWAALIGVYRKDASAASGQAAFTGQITIPPLIIPTGTALITPASVPYVTTAEGTLDAGGGVTVPMTASENGAITNCSDGTPISLASPILGVNAAGVTVGDVTGGADQELDADFRTRMLAAYAAPPHGGDAADYQRWATEVPGCTRAWTTANGMGLGSVLLHVMFDEVRAATGGFPDGANGCATEETRGPPASGDQLAVAEHIWPQQPITALVYVSAPIAYPVDVALQALAGNTAAIQSAIVAALNDMFLLKGVPGGAIYPSDIALTVGAVEGVQHFAMTQPEYPVLAPPGHLPVMGNLTVSS